MKNTKHKEMKKGKGKGGKRKGKEREKISESSLNIERLSVKLKYKPSKTNTCTLDFDFFFSLCVPPSQYERTILFTSISVSRTLARIFIIELSSCSSSLVATAAATSIPCMIFHFLWRGGSKRVARKKKLRRKRYRLALPHQQGGGEGAREGAERGEKEWLSQGLTLEKRWDSSEMNVSEKHCRY